MPAAAGTAFALMPLFGLTPIEAGLDNADWSGSTHRGPCRVVAADERRARLFAANLFTDRKATRTPAGLLPASPWMRRGLVSAERVLGLADNLKADGTVLVPADLDDPGGAYRVFGTGRMVLSGPLQIRHANAIRITMPERSAAPQLGGAALRAEVERLRRDCAEAYQVIGALALRTGLLQYPAVEKALENLDAATRGDPRPHADLLPIFLPDNENH
ncbi:MAG: hypothetical protein ICV73_23200 [Acetobacteraceae bacterium]|nr:hypothetical protein [Acetobacteraceae bacterium]